MFHSYIITIQPDAKLSTKDSRISYECNLSHANMVGIASVVESLFGRDKDKEHIKFYLIAPEGEGDVFGIERLLNRKSDALENIEIEDILNIGSDKYDDLIAADIPAKLVKDKDWVDKFVCDGNIEYETTIFYGDPKFNNYSLFISNHDRTKYSFHEIGDIETLKGIILGCSLFVGNLDILENLAYKKYPINVHYDYEVHPDIYHQNINNFNLCVEMRYEDLFNIDDKIDLKGFDIEEFNIGAFLGAVHLIDDNVLLLILTKCNVNIPENRYKNISNKCGILLNVILERFLFKSLIGIVLSYML